MDEFRYTVENRRFDQCVLDWTKDSFIYLDKDLFKTVKISG